MITCFLRYEIDVYKVQSAGGKTEAKVYGVSHLQTRLVHLSLDEGRFFDARDDENHAAEA